VAEAQVRGFAAQARSNRFRLEHAIEDVNNQIAMLGANVAALDSDLAKRDRALKDFERIKELRKTPGAGVGDGLKAWGRGVPSDLWACASVGCG
jgi:hypothetical protein